MDVIERITFWIQLLHKLLDEAQFDVKRFLFWLHQRCLFHVMSSNIVDGPRREISFLVVKACISVIAKAEIAKELSEAYLESHCEGHRLEIPNQLPTVLDIFEST